MTPQLKAPECPECGGSCDPECGRHPLGCLFRGNLQCGPECSQDDRRHRPGCLLRGRLENGWAVAPGCKLPHENVSHAIAQDVLRGMTLPGLRVI